MYNEEDMKDALKRFDWAAVQALLPNRDTPTLKKLLGDVSHSGCFIRLHPLKPAEDQRRSAMRTELRTLAATIAGVDAGKFVDFLLNQVDITEAALDVINENVDNDPYSGFDVPTQAWAALEWALLEMVDVHRQMHEGLQNSQENGTVFIDPLNLRVNSQNGSSLAGGRINMLSQTAANTLRMLGHRNRWSKTGRFTLPPRVAVGEAELLAAQRISRLGDVWQAIVDESKHHRYWGGYFSITSPNQEQLETLPDLKHVFESVKTEQERGDGYQIAEFIAHHRIERRMMGVGRFIAQSDAKTRIKNPRVEQVALSPTGLVSELEMATLYVLDNDMHFNPIKGTTEYGGLTVAEWLRGYCVLEECYAGGATAADPALLEVDVEELSQTLQRAGLTQAKTDTFLGRVTFQSGRRDLYDAPLLRTGDGKCFFVAALYRGVNVPLIIASQIGTLGLNVESKGQGFEDDVLEMFSDAGVPAKTFKFRLRETDYQCDVAVLWDNRLLVIECKNYGLPTDDPADRFYFWKRQADALKQVERIAQDLADNPDIVRKHFGDEAQWQAVHPVVLNASFLSFHRSPKGTYFYDGSALGRFLKEGTLNVIRSVGVDGGRVEHSQKVKHLWKGERPTVDDLLREMKSASQVELEKDEYYIARKLLSISPDTAVLICEASSKPPGFQPLQTEEERKALLSKVSKRHKRSKRR